jgi:hypothetical protein
VLDCEFPTRQRLRWATRCALRSRIVRGGPPGQRRGVREDGARRARALHQGATQAFPSLMRSILTEIHLCQPCSCPEILRVKTPGQGRLPGGGAGGYVVAGRLARAAAPGEDRPPCVLPWPVSPSAHQQSGVVARHAADQQHTLLRRRARHLPVTVAGVDTHSASIMCAIGTPRANACFDCTHPAPLPARVTTPIIEGGGGGLYK